MAIQLPGSRIGGASLFIGLRLGVGHGHHTLVTVIGAPQPVA